MKTNQTDAETFFWYASQWRSSKDKLAYLALMDLRDNKNLSPLLLKRIGEIEAEYESSNSRSLRGSSVA